MPAPSPAWSAAAATPQGAARGLSIGSHKAAPAQAPAASAPAQAAPAVRKTGGTNAAPVTALVSVPPSATSPKDLGLPVDRHGKYQGMDLKGFDAMMKQLGVAFSADPEQKTQNMGKLLELLNYSAHPEMVDDLSKKFHFRRHPEEMMYRGVANEEGRANEFMDAFRQGDLFVGGGVYGSGAYFASGHQASTMRTAKDYANRVGGNEGTGTETGPNERSAIGRFAMKKGARILDFDPTYGAEGDDMINRMRREQIEAAGEGVDPGLLEAIKDDGFFASMLGYDAIRIAKSAPGAAKKRNWIVGLNRGMMIGDRVKL